MKLNGIFKRRKAAGIGEGNKQFDEIALPPKLANVVKSYSLDSEGMMDEWELSELVRSLIFSRPQDSEVILELGTYKGNTASLMADTLNRLNMKNLIVAIDAFDMVTPDATNPSGSLEQWIDKNARWRNASIMIRGFTKDVATFIKPGCASLLIIDAYHEYESVREDIKMYLPAVKKGGVIFIDDYNKEFYPGVFRATNELLVDNKTVETIKASYYAVFRKK